MHLRMNPPQLLWTACRTAQPDESEVWRTPAASRVPGTSGWATIVAVLVGALLLLSASEANACACCEQTSDRAPVGWSSDGTRLLVHYQRFGCELYSVDEMYQVGQAAPTTCFDRHSATPTVGSSCGTPADGYETATEEPEPFGTDSGQAAGLAPAHPLARDQFRASIRVMEQFVALLKVEVVHRGRWHEVMRERVNLGRSEYDDSGYYMEGDHPLAYLPYAIEVDLFASPATPARGERRQALLRWTGSVVSEPGDARMDFGHSLRWVALPRGFQPRHEGQVVQGHEGHPRSVSTGVAFAVPTADSVALSSTPDGVASLALAAVALRTQAERQERSDPVEAERSYVLSLLAAPTDASTRRALRHFRRRTVRATRQAARRR